MTKWSVTATFAYLDCIMSGVTFPLKIYSKLKEKKKEESWPKGKTLLDKIMWMTNSFDFGTVDGFLPQTDENSSLYNQTIIVYVE